MHSPSVKGAGYTSVQMYVKTREALCENLVDLDLLLRAVLPEA